MIQLFLDNQPAIPTDNATIKLTVENPYFTKSTSYTYDVDLPLDIEENRNIFGFINRIDIEKEAQTFSARLVVDNVCVLAGTAHITSITEKSVKVQLLGSAASYNYGNKMDDTYIDELDMGDWFMTTWPDGSHWVAARGNANGGYWDYYPSGTKFTGLNANVFSRASYESNGSWSDGRLLETLYSGELPWVAFPTLNSTADFLCNGLPYRLKSPDSTEIEQFYRGYVGEKPNHRATSNSVVSSGAIQPYVWMMAQKIAEATGFSLSKTNNALYTNDFFRKIFIVNTNNFIECNKCLPHWSVNEWWTQLENTFGVILSVDYNTKSISLLHRNDHYSYAAKTVHLIDVVDEFTSEVDDETQSDISVSNVAYSDFDCAKSDLLSEFILSSAQINSDFSSLTALLQWASGKDTDELAAMKHVIFDCSDGRRYIYSDAGEFVEVDMFRERIVNEKSDSAIELKFVPAKFVDVAADIYRAKNSGVSGGTPPPDTPIGSLEVRAIAAPGIAEMDWYKDHADYIDIEAIINEDEEEGSVDNSSEDLIYIAIADLNRKKYVSVNQQLSTGQTVNQYVSYPLPYLRERTKGEIGGLPVNEDSPFSLSLIPIVGQVNIAANTIAGSVAIDATVRHCIRFIAASIPDPGSVFIIRNRRFVCEKIEADIDTHGLKRQLTGYFYELKQ